MEAATTPIASGTAPRLHGPESTEGIMRAIVQDAYGSTEVLRLTEIPRPEIAANEVLVKVVAAGMDRGTAHVMTGKPYLMRVLGFGFRRPKNRVPWSGCRRHRCFGRVGSHPVQAR